jgi:hypothetical protein
MRATSVRNANKNGLPLSAQVHPLLSALWHGCDSLLQPALTMTQRFCLSRSSEHSWTLQWPRPPPPLPINTQPARSTRRNDISTIWLLPLSRKARSYRGMMDTMFESYAQYSYLTVMRYYACIKGIVEGSSQWSSLSTELQWIGGDKLNCIEWRLLRPGLEQSLQAA